MTLPAVMLAVLFYTLVAADSEHRAWIARIESARQKAVTNSDIESIPFVLPFQHNARILDAIGLQWPAFAVAGLIAPVPQLYYSERKPSTATSTSYVALPLAVGIYWFLFAVWIDRRLIQRLRPVHSKVVRIILIVTFALTGLFFLLFLGKDLMGGWPEGPQGAYGVTGWLAVVSAMLLTEINGFRREPRTVSKLS
jgi:hypothetical protein